MSKVTKYFCDIEDCGETTMKRVHVPVIFTTEQTEGRGTEPYLEIQEIDICDKHYKDLIYSSPLTAQGAMGHNRYRLDVKLVRNDKT